ncbi:MAG: hypothetical protein PHP59_08325 [Methanofollis sp.]|uniref:hypothetical protein n=1 Tax=Methanofollis sp. TaxID=2052835 RepID=UPI0026129664|nr:hypothetical protein [Methanofollis sp.]MDD4255365.1 hypothetical protein [Methanofollis sp.]
MKICPRCSYANQDDREVCTRCACDISDRRPLRTVREYLLENASLFVVLGVFGALAFYLTGLLSKTTDPINTVQIAGDVALGGEAVPSNVSFAGNVTYIARTVEAGGDSLNILLNLNLGQIMEFSVICAYVILFVVSYAVLKEAVQTIDANRKENNFSGYLSLIHHNFSIIIFVITFAYLLANLLVFLILTYTLPITNFIHFLAGSATVLVCFEIRDNIISRHWSPIRQEFVQVVIISAAIVLLVISFEFLINTVILPVLVSLGISESVMVAVSLFLVTDAMIIIFTLILILALFLALLSWKIVQAIRERVRGAWRER